MTDFVPCVGCGASLHRTAQTCPKCGAPQPAAASSTVNSPRAPDSMTAPPVVPPLYRRNGFVVIALLLIPVVALVIAVTGPVYRKYRRPDNSVFYLTTSRWLIALIASGWMLLWVFGFGQRFDRVAGLLEPARLTCDAPAVAGVVKDIVTQQVSEMDEFKLLAQVPGSPVAGAIATVKSMPMKLVATTSPGGNKRALQCTGQLEIGLTPALTAAMDSPMMQISLQQSASTRDVQRSGNRLLTAVEYTVTRTGGDEIQVELHASDGLRQVLGALGLFDAVRSKEGSANAAPGAGPSGSPLPATTAPTAAANASEPASSMVAGQTSPSAPTSEPVIAKESPLCQVNEGTIFGCSTGKKLVAICQRDGEDGSPKVLTYRIGTSAQAVEMSYPEREVAASTVFRSGVLIYPDQRRGVALSFGRGDYRYVLHHAAADPTQRSGVLVEKSGQRIAELDCGYTGSGTLRGDVFDLPSDDRPIRLSGQ